jgi:hypothetical protein
MENNNLSILANRHTTIAFLATPMSPIVVIGIFPTSIHNHRHTPLHWHQQLSAIGIAQQPPPDSAISSSCCPIIGNIDHRQFLYRPYTSLL